MHTTTANKDLKSTLIRGGIILPIIIVGALAFVFVRVDLRATFESEQFKKNKAYVQNLIEDTIGDKFFETNTNPDTNKTATFNLSSFLPQINMTNTSNSNLQNSQEVKTNNEEGGLDSNTSGFSTVR